MNTTATTSTFCNCLIGGLGDCAVVTALTLPVFVSGMLCQSQAVGRGYGRDAAVEVNTVSEVGSWRKIGTMAVNRQTASDFVNFNSFIGSSFSPAILDLQANPITLHGEHGTKHSKPYIPSASPGE